MSVFVKKVVNGKMVEIDRVTFWHLFKLASMPKERDEEMKEIMSTANLLSLILKIDGESFSAQDILEFDDLDVFNFINQTMDAMTKKINL